MIFPFLISRENLYQIAPQYLSLIEMINVFRDHYWNCIHCFCSGEIQNRANDDRRMHRMGRIVTPRVISSHLVSRHENLSVIS